MDKLYIIMPAYNEEENIGNVVDNWMKVVERINKESRLVVINDGSKDNTLSKLEELSNKYTQLIVLNKPNSGHGPTLIYGYKYALENGADFIFQTDSDNQTNPDEFDGFWVLRNQYDAILGNRVVRGDGLIRKFVENVVCLILRIIFGVKVPDANAPFRLMKASLVSKYINKLPEDFNIPNIMLTTYFEYYEEKIKFVVITFNSRNKGTNTINISKIIKIGLKAIKDFKVFRKLMVTENKAR